MCSLYSLQAAAVKLLTSNLSLNENVFCEDGVADSGELLRSLAMCCLL